MHIAMKWVTFLVAVGLVFYYSKYEFGPFAKQHPGHKTLDGTTFYWPSDVRPLLDGLGDFRINYSEQERTVDLIFPLIYGLMFVAPIVWMSTATSGPRLIALLPVIAVVADYVENVTVIALLKRYPGDLGWLPNIASMASAAKGTGLLASFGAVIVLAITWLARLRTT